uniref:uncharacterized protein LOC122761810 n=1 Tax=Solea senegalensis TaxID=28829 RepID=UPI001CD8B7D3|nr:uncharacterized protein LOC122761810 [Solea senegalensis]
MMAALLRWTAVTLVFFLSTEDRADAVDPQRLSRIVRGLLRQYGVKGMFSLAVSVPENQNQNQNINQILRQVFESDPADDVKNTINNGEVYVGSRVVAAKVLRLESGSDHAEARVASSLAHFTQSLNDNDLLLFYVYASPCAEKCTLQGHRKNILQDVGLLQQWTHHAFVFSKIFTSTSGFTNTQDQLQGALRALGAAVGQDSVFRCDGPECVGCFSDNQHIAPYCVSDQTQTDTRQVISSLQQGSSQGLTQGLTQGLSQGLTQGLTSGRGQDSGSRGGGGGGGGGFPCRRLARRAKRSIGGNDDSDSGICSLSPQNGSSEVRASGRGKGVRGGKGVKGKKGGRQ